MARSSPESQHGGDRRFGIRVSLPPGDPFANLVGGDWETWHWYPDAASRDRALAEMAKRHVYSRIGDDPQLVFEAVDP